jgi:hydroxymethylbilane synthase
VAQLRAHRPDLVFVAVRGNVDTRLRKLSSGDFDALVVAYAGLSRLGLTDRAAEIIPPEVCLPAPGQGALALQVRETDSALREMLTKLDHRESRLAVAAERAFLARLGAGCSVPAGALGVMQGDRLTLRVAVADPEGRRVIRRKADGPAEAGEALGQQLAEEVLAEGADRIMVGEPW